ncbi:hypothetical protein [Campylobacter rectus]|uniref:hypothetical protein n=1 Tax=Campylobacter rectus TaxID=203 RepID=UPI000F5E39E3|nr:hypothetical protein [Campylobacter rectus]RRD52461.1 hypothetical protein EII16_10895 [Campylobacter rectus]
MPFLFSIRNERCLAGILTEDIDAGKIAFGIRKHFDHSAKFRRFFAIFFAALMNKNVTKYPLSCFL